MTTTPMPGTTRNRILDAGQEIWATQNAATLFAGFSVAKVSEAASVTRSTFYSYWPSTEHYLVDLVAHLASTDANNYPAAVAKLQDTIVNNTASTDLVSQIIQGCALHLRAAIDDPTLGLRLGFLAKADDPDLTSLLNVLYRTGEISQYAPFAVSMESWGRVLRPPFTESRLQVVFSALLEGLAARHRIDPDSVPVELYGQALLPLLLVATRRPDDDRSLEQIVDSLNSWPAMGLAYRLHEQAAVEVSPPTTRATSESMREVTISIRRLLARVGFSELSLTEISLVTGYSEAALQQMFGSRPGIALCVYLMGLNERYATIPESLRGIDRLRAMIEINFDEIRRAPVMTQNMVLLLAGHNARPRLDLVDFDARSLMDDAVRESIDRGELNDQFAPHQFSQVLQRTILIEGSPVDSVLSSGIDVVELLLSAAGAPPPTATSPRTTLVTQ
ncbi:MAG: hypothetical protein F2597_00255 [Actinobacteria bacterium]|uniref:Unannotated protein n=1 Tax=freshwater metagenome TaxID=449393 RepID=A0A6J6EED3_9ZZZZ|nr:hypothetical protein [Actinomycetota bacterium]MSZ51137.1 hypothetical protein [Actinomycetota bacterium]MTA41465.1 hypothetical protein [Actinomycetota bacterium]